MAGSQTSLRGDTKRWIGWHLVPGTQQTLGCRCSRDLEPSDEVLGSRLAAFTGGLLCAHGVRLGPLHDSLRSPRELSRVRYGLRQGRHRGPRPGVTPARVRSGKRRRSPRRQSKGSSLRHVPAVHPGQHRDGHVHHFTPTCNGERNPSWRSPKDPGFPERCRYGGTRRAVAVGSLDRGAGTIRWDKCKAAATYWSKDRRAYTTEEKSRGRGCLDQMRGIGNVHCEGRLGCRLGELSRGDNAIEIDRTQPLLSGPPGTEGRLFVSNDLTTIRSPEPASGGFASYNLPNDSPSRLWFSFEGTQSSASKLTTCPPP